MCVPIMKSFYRELYRLNQSTWIERDPVRGHREERGRGHKDLGCSLVRKHLPEHLGDPGFELEHVERVRKGQQEK